jgi:hypothetical protein
MFSKICRFLQLGGAARDVNKKSGYPAKDSRDHQEKSKNAHIHSARHVGIGLAKASGASEHRGEVSLRESGTEEDKKGVQAAHR